MKLLKIKHTEKSAWNSSKFYMTYGVKSGTFVFLVCENTWYNSKSDNNVIFSKLSTVYVNSSYWEITMFESCFYWCFFLNFFAILEQYFFLKLTSLLWRLTSFPTPIPQTKREGKRVRSHNSRHSETSYEISSSGTWPCTLFSAVFGY